MPWNKSEVSEFKSGLTESQKEKWVEIANSYLENCDKDQETCEEEAIKLANSRVGDSAMDKTLRVDDGQIKDWRYDEEEEVLTADVLITKSQVLPYKDDGDVVHELLPPDELREDSWHDSIKSKAVTDLHPDEEVNYRNIGEHSLGSLHNDVWIEENGDKVEVWAKETVYDENLIQDIKDGKKQQVSIGRFVNVVDESGEFGGVTYDKKQTDFELNHLAHVPQGRAGQDVKVRLDGDSIVAKTKDDNSVSVTNEGDSKPDKTANTDDEVRHMKLTIGDRELALDEDLEEDTVEEFQDEIDERLHELRDKDEKLNDKEDKLDEKDEKLGKLEGRLDSLEDKVSEDVTEDKINEKLALIEDVKEVMPDYDWKGKTSIEMKADVIKAVFDGVDLEDKSEAYVNGRYDSAMEKAKESNDRKLTIKPDGEDDGELSKAEENRKELQDMYEG